MHHEVKLGLQVKGSCYRIERLSHRDLRCEFEVTNLDSREEIERSISFEGRKRWELESSTTRATHTDMMWQSRDFSINGFYPILQAFRIEDVDRWTLAPKI